MEQVSCNSGFLGDETSCLPEGWNRKIVQRASGKSAGKYDAYIYSPTGKKFRSRMEIQKYLEESGSDLKIDQFDFKIPGCEQSAVKAKPRSNLASDAVNYTDIKSGDFENAHRSPVKKQCKEKHSKSSKEVHSTKFYPVKSKLIVKMNFHHKKKANSSDVGKVDSYAETALPVKKRRNSLLKGDTCSVEIDSRQKGQPLSNISLANS